MNHTEKTIPVWKKYSLNVSEAAEYYGIGEKRLRQIAGENEGQILFWKLVRISGSKENYLKIIWTQPVQFK